MKILNPDSLDNCVPSFYQKSGFFLVRKPHNIATTFGKEYSFLDFLFNEHKKFNTHLSVLMAKNLSLFGKDRECGLLNRLDTATAGFLYFADSEGSYESYKLAHKNRRIYKYYVADVLGRFEKNEKRITSSLFHHKYENDRMVVYRGEKDKTRIRGKEHRVETVCKQLSSGDEISSVLVCIQHGIRHQIRAHLSSIGQPIIGDSLYGKKQDNVEDILLHLWSVGFSIY